MDHDTQKLMLLQKSRLFSGFEQETIETIAAMLVECHFTSGQLVCLKGDESDSLYVIAEGEAEVSVSSRDGRVILLGTLGTGDVFGEIGLLDGQARTANVTASTNLKLYRLKDEDFNSLARKFGIKEWMALSSYICFLFRRVTNNLEETMFLDASIRIASRILALVDQETSFEAVKHNAGDNSLEITISQENLGRMAGLSREATNKALSKLEEHGLIARKYKRIIIPDITRLSALITPEAA